MTKHPWILALISVWLPMLSATTVASEDLNELDLPGPVSIPPTAPPQPSPRDCQIYLDADTPATGSLLGTEPLVSPFGTITCSLVQIFTSTGDPDTEAAGASGNGFDIVDSPISAAIMIFDFDVESVQFIYGGNGGSILVQIRDINDVYIDSFFQLHTEDGQPAGPRTLSGSGIRILEWQDPPNNYAVLDNICITPQAGPVSVDTGSWGRTKAQYH